jgi:hypothetical protein
MYLFEFSIIRTRLSSILPSRISGLTKYLSVTKTARGRTILKHGAAATGSGAIIHVGDPDRTKSGRIVRKPARYRVPIAKKGDTVPATREDGGNSREAVGGDQVSVLVKLKA